MKWILIIALVLVVAFVAQKFLKSRH